MSFETIPYIEARLENCGKMLHELLELKDYANAKKIFGQMKIMTNGCKLRLLGIMLKTGSKMVAAKQFEKMEEKAAVIVAKVLEEEAYAARMAMLSRIFGKVATRFLGPLGAAFIVKDLGDGAIKLADSMQEQMGCNRIAQYGDYMEETASDGKLASLKLYKDWFVTEYLPGQHQKRSEFYRNLKTVFPYSIPI